MSVIVPVYQGRRFVAEAIASLHAQDYPAIEIVAVDDGSTDGSADLLRTMPGVRSLRQERAGVAAARNAGLRASDAPLVAFLDQDDLWPAGKLSRQVSRILNEPRVDVVLGRFVYFDHDDRRLHPGWPSPSSDARPAFLVGAMLVRRTVFEQIGDFDTRYVASDDSDWLIRARDAEVPVDMLPDTVLYKRRHDANLSADVGRMRREMVRVVRDSVHRKRRT